MHIKTENTSSNLKLLKITVAGKGWNKSLPITKKSSKFEVEQVLT